MTLVGAVVGSIIFLIGGLVGCLGIGQYVVTQTVGSRQTKMENRE